MKFYRPDIVNRWNEDHLGVHKTLYDQEWDDTQDAYEKHRESLNLPTAMKSFGDLVLHNETIIAMPKLTQGSRVVGYDEGDYTIVTCNWSDGMLHVVTYHLEAAPEILIHSGNGFDAPGSESVWLYDEFDVDDKGRFRHSVLFSNGIELVVTFKAMHWIESQVLEQG